MNARSRLLILAVALLLLFAVPAAGEPRNPIIVVGADEVVENSLSADPDMLSVIAEAGQRVVVEYANHVMRMDLSAVPALFQALLDTMSLRVVVENSNAILREDLESAPAALQARLDQVAQRVVIDRANANLGYELQYPRALVNDPDPPVVSRIHVGTIQASGVLTVTWLTDELADSTIFYGTTTGSYPQTRSDPRHVITHALGLPDLTEGVTYYYKLRSADLSENVTTTQEYTFTAKRAMPVYLPIVYRVGP